MTYNRKLHDKEYLARPEVKVHIKEYTKEYLKRPEVKVRKKNYNKSLKMVQYRKEYYRRPEVKARNKTRQSTPEERVKQKKYRQENPEIFARGYERHRAKYPKRTWAARVIASHQQRGFKVRFSVASLTKNVAFVDTCPVCGKHIEWLYKHSQDFRGPGLACPSLDRRFRDSVLTLKNTQLMCFQCNVGKSSGTIEEYIQHCKNVAIRHP